MCELLQVRNELELAQRLAEENEAIAIESKKIAESSRLDAEEKEKEVKKYEKSVGELVTALQTQVDLVKVYAERQRLQREELELESHTLKKQICSDSDIKRILNEKEERLQEALQRVYLLEKEIANKDTEIFQHKTHISELNLQAQAQASEYKQKLKTLEVMSVDQVKADVSVIHTTNSPSKKLEKNESGSPFKCIGLGLAQQMKSEKDDLQTDEITEKAQIMHNV